MSLLAFVHELSQGTLSHMILDTYQSFGRPPSLLVKTSLAWDKTGVYVSELCCLWDRKVEIKPFRHLQWGL